MKSIPILKIRNIEASHDFYTKLGFTQRFIYRPDPTLVDPAYAGYELDGAIVHLSSHSGDSNYGCAVVFYCDSVDAVYERLANDIPESVKLPPTDQTWGNRELYIEDLDGHSLRFTCDIQK